MDLIIMCFAALILVGLGLVLGITLHKKQLKSIFDKSQTDSQKILEEAQAERDRIIREANAEAKEENRERRNQFETESKKRRAEMQKLEQKVQGREQALEKKMSILDKKEADLEKVSVQLHAEEAKYKRVMKECEASLEQQRHMLETVAKLSQEEAKKELIRSLEAEAKKEAKETIKKIEDDAREEALRRARSMVSLAVQRVSSEYVNDTTVSVVALPSDEMKGRIIGREGRNIRAIEQTTGVDLIIDDTPEAVILSCFNPIRREIAKTTLERLIADGRIHPARIEETVRKVEKEFDQIIYENGEQAAFDTGVTDLPQELIKNLGKLKYRTSGQQTVLQHAVEVAHICGIMAGEMGLDVRKAKRAGLLHDIGKAVDQETEGHHSSIGGELLRRFNESDEIVNAVLSHHDEDLSSARPLTVVLHAANLLSANRPGARREVLETYVKRLQDMEDIVKSFSGIESCFVMQAGREIRAIVTPTDVSDADVTHLSNDIAFKLRTEMQFPGQVMVTVVRESKFVDYAK